MQRRKFVQSIALGGIGIALAPIVKAAAPEKAVAVKPASNIQDALKYSPDSLFNARKVSRQSCQGEPSGMLRQW
jgi:hypothetical protein